MKHAVLLATLALGVAAVTTSASASRTIAPPPAAARAAFGHLLHQLYAGIHGYWTCPYEHPPVALDECLGEVDAGRLRHEVGADVSSKYGEIAFDHVFGQT